MDSLKELIAGMPGQRPVLLGIIDFCRESRTPSEVDAYTEELQKANVSIYTPVLLRQHLQSTGALQYIEADTESNAKSDIESSTESSTETSIKSNVESDIKPSTDANTVLDIGSDTESDMKLGGVQGSTLSIAQGEQDTFVQGAQNKGYSEAQSDTNSNTKANNSPEEPEFLAVSNQADGHWLSSAEALEFLDNIDFSQALVDMLNEEPEYNEIYLRILKFCTHIARNKEQINMLVDNDPILQNPRRYSGYFIERLDDCGALSWQPNWITTDIGIAFIDTVTNEGL